MKAVWKETASGYYYGETSLADPTKFHGKGVIVNKESKQLHEGWWVNDEAQGKGRWINGLTGDMYVGEWLRGKRHG